MVFAGGANGSIYLWNGKTLQKTLPLHKGFVSALKLSYIVLLSGGKDGNICLTST